MLELHPGHANWARGYAITFTSRSFCAYTAGLALFCRQLRPRRHDHQRRPREAYGANMGWINFRGDVTNGNVIGLYLFHGLRVEHERGLDQPWLGCSDQRL